MISHLSLSLGWDHSPPPPPAPTYSSWVLPHALDGWRHGLLKHLGRAQNLLVGISLRRGGWGIFYFVNLNFNLGGGGARRQRGNFFFLAWIYLSLFDRCVGVINGGDEKSATGRNNIGRLIKEVGVRSSWEVETQVFSENRSWNVLLVYPRIPLIWN